MTSLSALKFKEPRKEGTADKLQSLAGVKPAVSPPVLCFHRSGQQLAAQIEDCIWCAKIRFLERCLALALCCPVKAMITCCFWRTSRKLGQTDAFKSSNDPAVRGSERGYINNSFPWTLLWVIERPTGWFMMSWTLMRQGCIWLWPGGELLFPFVWWREQQQHLGAQCLAGLYHQVFWLRCWSAAGHWHCSNGGVFLQPPHPSCCLFAQFKAKPQIANPLFVRPTTGQ